MATIEIEKDTQRQLTILTVKGDVTAEEISNAIVTHNQTEQTKLILWDLSQATFNTLDSSQVGEFVHLTNQYIEKREGGKTAIVASSELGFGYARMYEIIQEYEHPLLSRMTFRDKDSAVKWLLE